MAFPGMAQDLVIGMAGAGGDGIVSAGESLIEAGCGWLLPPPKSFGRDRGGEPSCRPRRPPRLNPSDPDVAV